MTITKEISVYFNGRYFQSMREVANTFKSEEMDDDLFYGRIKNKLKIYGKVGDLIIVKDNRLENYLKGIKTKKKDIKLYALDIEGIINNCPFDWRKSIEERRQKRLEENERPLKRKYYKDPEEKKEKVFKEKKEPLSLNTLNTLNILKRLKGNQLQELSFHSGISIGILRSLILNLYGPSQIIEDNIKYALKKMNIN